MGPVGQSVDGVLINGEQDFVVGFDDIDAVVTMLRLQTVEGDLHLEAGEIAVDGGWRIYSSGPGLYTNLLLRHALGVRRHFGERIAVPSVPRSVAPVTLEMAIDGRRERFELGAA